MSSKKILYSIILLTVFFCVAFTSCITPRKTNYLQNPSHKIPTYNDSLSFQEYKLIKGDKIYIRVFSTNSKMNTLFNGSSQIISTVFGGSSDNSDLYTYTVREDGTILLPSVGSVNVLGKSIREIKNIVEEELNPFFKDKFAVDVKNVDKYYSIIGSSANGRYSITKEKMNIFQALAMAGDISTFGDRSKIKILREVKGTTQIKTFDIRSKDIINSEFYYIQNNDVIYIQDVNEQFFSVTSFGAALSTIISTISFGLFIYNIAIPNAPTSTQ